MTFWHLQIRFSYNCVAFMQLSSNVCVFVLVHVSGVCVKDRWRELLQVTQPHTDDHATLFNDLHFLMVSLGAKESGTSQRLLEGLQELAK